jgi:hypothetical protein
VTEDESRAWLFDGVEVGARGSVGSFELEDSHAADTADQRRVSVAARAG